MWQPNGQLGNHVGLIIQLPTTTDTGLHDTTVLKTCPWFPQITTGIMTTKDSRGTVTMTGDPSSITDRKWIKGGIHKLNNM